ncbi:MAG: 50S ribosomal protein L23 [Planctomycetales bacterium]|nr:50S ribosomal protein L23 [Planctomycetales bacterium]
MAQATKQQPQAEATTRLELAPYQIILRPLVTEKAMHRSEAFNQYAFEVNPLATKTQIRAAVEELFDVKVAKVCIHNRLGKPRRYRFKFGRTKAWKKALVTLDREHNISFF